MHGVQVLDKVSPRSLVLEPLLPNKKYNIIYADPPWKYKESWGNGSNEHTYSTMTNKDIINLPVQNITEDKSHFLGPWTSYEEKDKEGPRKKGKDNRLVTTTLPQRLIGS